MRRFLVLAVFAVFLLSSINSATATHDPAYPGLESHCSYVRADPPGFKGNLLFVRADSDYATIYRGGNELVVSDQHGRNPCH